MKKIVLVMVVAMLCSLNLSAGELEDNIKKCDGGDAQACLKVSDAYFSMDENHPKRSEFHEKACNLKNADGCMLVGFSYEKKGDMANAKIFYTKACDLGDQIACAMK